jgi:3-hydroxyisobutyrate dehydrogenase-like beta-hydroxyacid dehydrogenase
VSTLTLGFVGLGQMGLPMVRTLSRPGFAVDGFDVAALRRYETLARLETLFRVAAKSRGRGCGQ